MAKQRVIHQLVHTLSYGDAISSEVLALQRALRDLGIAGEIFSIHTHPKLKAHTKEFSTFPKEEGAEVILHYSLGSPLNDLYQSLDNFSRCLIFHNLTPAHWFEGINPRIVADIERGARELPNLCSISDTLIADSRFNAEELNQLGFKAEVLELPVDPDRWKVEANSGIRNLLKLDPAMHLLHVGRFAPNKCIEDIIKVFYFIHHHIEKGSKLWLVGTDIDTELYSFSLKRLVRELDLENGVQFVGAMSDCEVRALYENCSAYLCMSEHEGFCLPVVEAMHFGLPVFSYASSALPDTIGSAGVLFSQKLHPQIAESIVSILKNSDLRAEMIRRGHERVQQLSFDKFKTRTSEIFSQKASREVANELVDIATNLF